jgi:cytochrome c-type biogenesis protein CcmH
MRGLALAAVVLLAGAPAVRAQTGAASPAPSAAPGSAREARDVLGVPIGRPLSGAELDAHTQEVAGLLRCPVCQGLSVADSPSSMAVKMKGQVRDLLAAGYDGDQVLAYFERSYGEFVRLKPPLRGINWLLWLAPGAALLGGAAVAWRTARRAAAQRAREAAASPTPAAAPADPRMEAYRARVRALAYGEGAAEAAAADPPPAGSRREGP